MGNGSSSSNDRKWQDLRQQIHTDISRFLKASKWVVELMELHKCPETSTILVQPFDTVIRKDERYEKFCRAYSRILSNIIIWNDKIYGFGVSSSSRVVSPDEFQQIFSQYCRCLTSIWSKSLKDVSKAKGEERVDLIFVYLFCDQYEWRPDQLVVFFDMLADLDERCS